MFLKSIALKSFLSYDDSGDCIDMKRLNVIIGQNGSGKSNLIEAIDIIRSAPKDLLTPIRDGGGVRDWLYKGTGRIPVAGIDAVFDYPGGGDGLRHVLRFTEVAQRFEIVDERVENALPDFGHENPYMYYRFENGHGVLNVRGNKRSLRHEEINPVLSIFAQRKDPDQYPEITYLGDMYSKIRLYREWSFGRYTPPRLPQKADLPTEYLEPDARNLGLVLNRMRREPALKRQFIQALGVLYDGIDDFDVQIEGGTVQVFLHEGRFTVPATRLSDGTLRYLSLLAILCHPDPGPLVCIEEPELGLHPDVLPALADLLKSAAERTQLIVTTHSDVLVDAMSDWPEAVLVAERNDQRSTLSRLDAEALRPWLEQYRLGQLWTRGDIGGTRW